MSKFGERDSGAAGWTFLTNHAHVLICLEGDPTMRLRDVAERVGITERAVQRIVGELEEAGYLSRDRSGRRNQYEVHLDQPLRHPIEEHRSVAALLELGREPKGRGASARTPSSAPAARRRR